MLRHVSAMCYKIYAYVNINIYTQIYLNKEGAGLPGYRAPKRRPVQTWGVWDRLRTGGEDESALLLQCDRKSSVRPYAMDWDV